MSQQYLPASTISELNVVKNQFIIWRENRKKRNEKIPDALILSAGKLIGSFSLNVICKSLRMNQQDFKARLNSINTIKTYDHLDTPEFVELNSFPQQCINGCTIEMEDNNGSKMKITGINSNDIINLAKFFWRK
ncbi:hypothetical protein MHK_009184 [Candidatus Magnetomorum sp. HK-1]|nr:hypothetical protein MHK_009184 [Candidatus Magnetomorum sp. HK-1]